MWDCEIDLKAAFFQQNMWGKSWNSKNHKQNFCRFSTELKFYGSENSALLKVWAKNSLFTLFMLV